MRFATRAAARALETGRLGGRFPRALASAWAPVAASTLGRPAKVPARLAVVCVGGATLGGSGKTRVAIACARELAAMGARVALVGHAYRGAVRRAKIVSPNDPLEEVGDEAIVCARALGSEAPVVVGPSRQAAIDLAVQLSPALDAIVLDGPLCLRAGSGARQVLSLLAVDAEAPWGSGRLPPAGDLRARPEALLARAHHVIPVDAAPSRVRWITGARRTEPLSELGAERGERDDGYRLFTAIARPDRLVRALRAAGVRLEDVVSAPDHGPAGVALRRCGGVGPWLATDKCALHLDPDRLRGPLGILEADLTLSPLVREALRFDRAAGPTRLDRPERSRIV